MVPLGIGQTFCSELGFDFANPREMPAGFSIDQYAIMFKTVAQITLRNRAGEEILLRKARTNKDISANFVKYEVIKKFRPTDAEVTMKGNNNREFFVATWHAKDFEYAIVSKVPLTEADMVGLIMGTED